MPLSVFSLIYNVCLTIFQQIEKFPDCIRNCKETRLFFPGQEPYPDGKSRGSPASVVPELCPELQRNPAFFPRTGTLP
ncbi:Uncharacterized protein dnm_075680 [Desulfonema magnum]|uniref:Uncharacterized protein n=1 Tax=Desulfonema magnum TaxID=45655 RepID=A0A975GRZ6_9BACT|nr:Uncharacterized protein dnm_075680 [Desulfonema magnum]